MVSPSTLNGRLPNLKSKSREEREDHARKNIAYVVVAAYVVFLLISATPAVIYLAKTGAPSLDDVKELTTALALGVSSLSGVLGFVLGYYFKASEKREG